MVGTENILAVLSDNDQGSTEAQDHFDHRSSKLAQRKGKEEKRAGRTEAQSWPGAATSDFPMETSQETQREGKLTREERKKRGRDGQKV